MAQYGLKSFRKSLDKNLSDYRKETSIHGVKYLANRSRPLPDRIFWIIIFIISIFFLGYFVYKIGQTWLENPIRITNENTPTHIFEIPFPAVTICPEIKIKADKFDFSTFSDNLKQFTNHLNFMDSNFGKKFVMASQICRKSFGKHIRSKFLDEEAFNAVTGPGTMQDDWINTLHDISPNFEEVFETCEMSSWSPEGSPWNAPSKDNCERLFSTIITNEGICFTFNTVRDVLRSDSLHTEFAYHNITRSQDGWDPENGYTKANAYPYKGIVQGNPIGSAGLKFVLAANLADITPFCSVSNVAYKIALHSPSEYPHMYDGFISLAYGKDYQIVATPKYIKTDDDLKSSNPNTRHCFFNEERKLKFYRFYNEENCRLECYANYSTMIHRGAPFSSPHASNITNSILPYKNFGWELPEYVRLFHEHFKVYGTSKRVADMVDYVDCDCLPECNAISYSSKIVTAHEEFYSDDIEDITSKNDGSAQTTVEIMFDAPSFIGQKRVRVYTFETMISDFGGLLGLFMGGSILSLFELFYFLTIRNCFKRQVDSVQN